MKTRSIIKWTIFLFVMMGFVSKLYAQEETFGAKAGDFSFTPQIAFESDSPDEGNDSQMLLATTGFGYYVSKQVEVDGIILVAGTGEKFTDTWMLGLMPALYYHLALSGNQRVVPHVGAGLGLVKYDSSDFSETGYQYSGILGLDWWVVKDGAVRMDFKYIHSAFSDVNVNTVGLFVGANLLFR